MTLLGEGKPILVHFRQQGPHGLFDALALEAIGYPDAILADFLRSNEAVGRLGTDPGVGAQPEESRPKVVAFA